MAVQKGIGPYSVGATNTDRIVRVQVLCDNGAGNNVFVFLKGTNAYYPPLNQVASPTVNQKAAQARLDAVVRAITIYMPVVGVKIGSGGAQTNNALILMFEADQNWFLGQISGVAGQTADLADTLGLAGQTAKTKPGLQSLLNTMLTTKSLDGGGTLLFAANPSLSDGTATTAAVVTTITASIV